MISALKSSSVVIAVCCIVCSMLCIVAPIDRMKKTVDLVLALFLLSSMIVPIVSFFLSFDDKIIVDEQPLSIDTISDEEYKEFVLNQTASNLVTVADELLISEGIDVDNIILSLKNTDKNSIYISRIDIYINKKYEQRLDDIKRIVAINMSKEPEIYINE